MSAHRVKTARKIKNNLRITMTPPQKHISFIVPLYNEAQNIPLLHKKLSHVCSLLPETYDYIFVNDGSTDESQAVLERIEHDDPHVRIIEFTRNFGKEVAMTAGLHAARHSDAAILLDADLQHPVELIPELIAKWHAGAETVIAVRKSNNQVSWGKKVASSLYYKILNSIAEVKVTPHATDYRLIDHTVIQEFNRLSERNRLTRGLLDWLGFRREYLYFDAGERANGEAAYNLKKLVRVAINSFVGLSLFPLRLAGYIGVVITIVASTLALFVLVEKYILRDPLNLHISSAAALIIANMLLLGVVLMALGLIALYIAHIHTEVINRPLYVVRRKLQKPGTRQELVKDSDPNDAQVEASMYGLVL